MLNITTSVASRLPLMWLKLRTCRGGEPRRGQPQGQERPQGLPEPWLIVLQVWPWLLCNHAGWLRVCTAGWQLESCAKCICYAA